MPRMTPIELYIANIRGDFPPNTISYQNAEESLSELKTRTGMDFGLDAIKWQAWLDSNPEIVPVKVTSIRDARTAASQLKPKRSESAGQ